MIVDNNNLYETISSVLDEIVDLSKNSVLSWHTSDDEEKIRVWEYCVALPKKESNLIYLIMPKEGVSVNLVSEQLDSSHYYIIDCYKQFESDPKATDPRSFFLNFLFNSEGYKNYFKNGSIFREIDSLYTKRSISIFNSGDMFENKNDSPSLEDMIGEWQEYGNRSLLILGDRGIGKTWAVLKYCYDNYKLHRENPWNQPIPIYLNLRGLSESIPGVTNLGELIFYHLNNRYNIKIFGGYYLFSSLLKSGKIILVFDGLDEMSKEVSDELTLKNIWQIFSVYPNTAKFILTSRINFFNSRLQIFEHFAYETFVKIKGQNQNFKKIEYSSEKRRVRQDFNIWEIKKLRDEEKTKLLEKVEQLNDQRIDAGLTKLTKLELCEDDTIQKELAKLSNTPGYFIPVVNLLAINKFPALIDIYETCINRVVIDFNIETDRAIDKYKLLTNDSQVEHYTFNAERKNEILRKLSWYMIERDKVEFDINEFPKYLKEIDGIDYEIVVNDLQTQTVITLNDNEKYSFISRSIFGFYAANYLFHQLNSDNNEIIKLGVQNLGKYDLLSHDLLRKVKIFLKAKFELLSHEKKTLIIKQIENTFLRDRPYSPWLKYLSSNAKQIGLAIDNQVLQTHDFWINQPISKFGSDTDSLMVLIPGNENIKPFFLGVNEVTNEEYLEFLESNDYNESVNDEECLGRYWYRSEVYKKIGKHDNPYLTIMNYYHIIFWKDDRIPSGKEKHPLVWISWFAAAKYCNWLSKKEGLSPYYKFTTTYKLEFERNEFSKIEIIKNSSGYRLPTEPEWVYAANEGSSSAHSLLDLCIDDKEKERIVQRFFDGDLKTTSSIRSEKPNKFGVYGLMGNVREWVDNPEVNELFSHTEQLIKGMGWLLGKEGFQFDHKSFLMAQNNNVDVGFRIARGLTDDELKKVQNAYLKNNQNL